MTAPFLPPFDVDDVLGAVAQEAHQLEVWARTAHDDRSARAIRAALAAGDLARAFDLARDLCSSGAHVRVRRHAVTITVLLTRVSDYLATAPASATTDPPRPTQPGCPLRPETGHALIMCEDGYTRSWRVDLDEHGHVTTATSDGFSDDGDGDLYLACIWCEHRHAATLTEDFQWD